MHIRALEKADLPSIKKFTDQVIGEGYFTMSELEEAFEKSLSHGVMCSFVLVKGKEILGVRLAYAPGRWTKGKGSKIRPDLWKVDFEHVGYFQSLFLSPEARSRGWGPKLSEAAIENFKKLGAKAIVTHAWKESPDNSSIRYLTKFGFKSIASHPDYWIDVDYTCVLDGKPCRCTAEEMIKYL